MEEVIYCIYCGQKNNAGDTKCVKCHKTLNPKENMIKDYLLRKTKDKFKGEIEDNMFEVVKNFLLSHVYGVVVTISVVAVMATSAFPLIRYEVERVPSSSNPNRVVFTQEEEDLKDVFVDYLTLYNFDISINPHIEGQVLAQRLPESYGYQGAHDIMFDVYNPAVALRGSYPTPDIDPDTPLTPLGRQLKDDGYKIAQFICERKTMKDPGNGEMMVVEERHFIVTAVYIDETWYFAEELKVYEYVK